MRRSVAIVLLLTLTGASMARPSPAGTEPKETEPGLADKIKAQLQVCPLGAQLQIRLLDNRQMDGELVARSEDSFDLAGPREAAGAKLATIRINDVSRLIPAPRKHIGLPRRQATTTTTTGGGMSATWRDVAVGVGAVVLLVGTLWAMKH
jgi:hypothetical protein